MAAKSKSGGLAGRLRTQAQSEAFLRTNPEHASLVQTLRSLQSDRSTAIGAAQTAGNANVQAARQAPADYQRTIGAATAAVHSPAAVAGVDNPLTGAGRDAAQTSGRLAEMLAAALTDAKQRELGAREGVQYATNKAEATYTQGAGSIRGRLAQLAREKGVFTQGRVADLTAADQKRADRGNARITAGVNPDGTIIPGGPKDPKANGKGTAGHGKPASAATLKALRSDVSTGKTAAAQLKQAGYSRGEADKLISVGQKKSAGQPVFEPYTDPRTKKVTNRRKLNPDGTQVTSGGSPVDIPQVSDALARGIAIDIAYDGGISRKHVKELIANGVAPGQFAGAVGAKTQQQRGIAPVRPSKPGSGAAGYSKGAGQPG